MKITVQPFLLISLLISMSTLAQQALTLSEAQKQLLDGIAVQDVPEGAPGIATGIVINGEIVYEKYAGYANLEDSTLIGEKSRFNIASNGKQFTALAILSLIENNRIKLDDDIRTFFPKLFPKIKSAITIEQLLNHSSGIRDVYGLWSLQGITWWKRVLTNEDALLLLHRQKELNFEPGSRYSYSNSNYMLLAEVIAKVSGTTFVAYTDAMFKSLNMPNTSFVSDHKNIRKPIAKPYFNFNTWKTYDWICDLQGDGNIFSTLADQLEWEKIIQTKKNDRFSEEIITRSQSVTPNSKHKNYGYGLEFGEHKGYPYAYHEGSTGAWKAMTTRFSKGNFAIVTLTNSGKTVPASQTLQMADVLLDVNSIRTIALVAPEKVGAAVSLEAILGTYQNNNDYTMQFVERAGDLYMLRYGRNDMKLVREAANIFQQWNDPTFKQEFSLNANGAMEVTLYHTTHAPYTLTRANSDWANYDFTKLNGKFQNEETEVTFEINYNANKIYAVSRNGKKMQALLVTPTKLMVNDKTVTFSIDPDGSITELFLTSGRIQNVRFSRVR